LIFCRKRVNWSNKEEGEAAGPLFYGFKRVRGIRTGKTGLMREISGIGRGVTGRLGGGNVRVGAQKKRLPM